MNAAARRLRQRLSVAVRRDPPRAVIRNANGVREEDFLRSALLVYLPDAFLMDESGPAWRRHQNRAKCKAMARVLGEMGYVVDVVHKHDRRFRPLRPYDLTVSEKRDWHGVDALLPDAGVRLFLTTTLEFVEHNARLTERHDRLARRRPWSRVAQRQINRDNAPAAASADAFTGIGNQLTTSGWRARYGAPFYPLNNFAHPDMTQCRADKDFQAARSHFLFLASRSQVRKGLDLLLEVFPRHPGLHLHVCSEFADEADFCAAYREELFGTPNVNPAGFVDIRGPEFEELVHRCAWVIHPSCSEGQAGAVVNCMHAGLVPILTPANGIDADGFGLTLEGDSIEEIEATVWEAAQLPADEVRHRATRAREVARRDHTEAAFVRDWRAMIEEVENGSAALRRQPGD